ncbi:alpha/beta hydrolase [Proteobacteria bacterium 005FR1]|nr:alpha/beta hydrolase [Proteobacteria bacterium 005FR1]
MSDYNELWYQSEDGLRLFARDYPCTDAVAGNPVIICLPGLTRNSADFHALALHLQRHYRVLALDLRGRGRSEWDANPENYNPGVYVRDLLHLQKTLDLQNVTLVGTSLGGLMSMLTASMQPSWLRGIVINDMGPDLNQGGMDRIKSYVGKSEPVADWEEAVAQNKSVNGSALPNLSEAQWQQFTRGLYREDDDGKPVLNYDPAIAIPFETAPATFDPAPLWAAFDAIPEMPMLLIRGALSDLLPAECADEMKRRRPSLAYAEIPNRGHAPLLDEPESIAAIDAMLEAASVSQTQTA